MLVLFIVIPSICWAQPTRLNGGSLPTLRKSCGHELVARVDRICQSRGGHMTYTRAQRIRRGIVTECCTNKCADHHLIAYCTDNKVHSKSIETDTSIEVPALPLSDSDLDVAEVRSPKQFVQNEESVTVSPIDKITSSENPLYPNVLFNGHVDSTVLEKVDRIIKYLPRNSNDYQIGTVPPEYLISNYIPSRARIISNY